MKRLICLLAIFFISMSVYAAEDTKTRKELIEEAKEKMSTNKMRTKNEGILLAKEIGLEEFVKVHVTEDEQIGLVYSVSSGSSTSEVSMVRADFLVILMDSKYEKVRKEAAGRYINYALYSNQPDAFKKLLGIMESEDPEVRLVAVQAITAINKWEALKPRKNVGSDDIIEKMDKYYGDKNTEVLLTLMKMIPESKNEKLIKNMKKLIDHKDPEVSRLAFSFFARNKIRDKSVLKAALKIVQEKDESKLLPQRAASRYLGVIEEKQAVPLIIDLLNRYSKKEATEDNDIKLLKIIILRALSRIGTDEALKYCVDFVQLDEPLEVVLEAGIAIQNITGKDIGFTEEMVPAQKQIADMKFKSWYIKDYVKEGDKRKEELAELDKEIKKFEVELQPTIVIEKVAYSGRRTVLSAARELQNYDIEVIVKEAKKSKGKPLFVQRLAGIKQDDDFNKMKMKIISHFLEEEDDEETQKAALDGIFRDYRFADYETVAPKLERISRNKENNNQDTASRVLALLKAMKSDSKPGPEEKKGPQ